MKKKIFWLFLVLSTLSLFNSCKDEKDDSNVTATSIILDKTSLALTVGEQQTLTATVGPSNVTDKTVTWTSSDNTKATVSDGKVTAVAVGTVTITAKAGDKTAICIVTISPIGVSTITLDKTTLAFFIGDQQTITATVSPSNAVDKTVTWTSSDTTKVTINNGKVTAVATGVVTITAKAGGKTATCSVTVKDGVIINGVRWATRNVSTPGSFVNSPEIAGMYFQWNSKTGGPATGTTVSSWNSSWKGGYTSPLSSDTWMSTSNPCPDGYRVPTYEEMKKLQDFTKVSVVWTIQNGVYGEKFTDIATNKSIFLPALGSRYGLSGSLQDMGAEGCYWTSTAASLTSTAYYLDFTAGGVGSGYCSRSYGLNVRPVAQ
jgi:hypothetical protein